MDAHANDSLSKAECQEIYKGDRSSLPRLDFFEELDEDGDGVVNLDEWSKFFGRIKVHKGSKAMELLVQQLERNVGQAQLEKVSKGQAQPEKVSTKTESRGDRERKRRLLKSAWGVSKRSLPDSQVTLSPPRTMGDGYNHLRKMASKDIGFSGFEGEVAAPDQNVDLAAPAEQLGVNAVAAMRENSAWNMQMKSVSSLDGSENSTPHDAVEIDEVSKTEGNQPQVPSAWSRKMLKVKTAEAEQKLEQKANESGWSKRMLLTKIASGEESLDEGWSKTEERAALAGLWSDMRHTTRSATDSSGKGLDLEAFESEVMAEYMEKYGFEKAMEIVVPTVKSATPAEAEDSSDSRKGGWQNLKALKLSSKAQRSDSDCEGERSQSSVTTAQCHTRSKAEDAAEVCLQPNATPQASRSGARGSWRQLKRQASCPPTAAVEQPEEAPSVECDLQHEQEVTPEQMPDSFSFSPKLAEIRDVEAGRKVKKLYLAEEVVEHNEPSEPVNRAGTKIYDFSERSRYDLVAAQFSAEKERGFTPGWNNGVTKQEMAALNASLANKTAMKRQQRQTLTKQQELTEAREARVQASKKKHSGKERPDPAIFEGFYERQLEYQAESSLLKAQLREASVVKEMGTMRPAPEMNQLSEWLTEDRDPIFKRYPEVQEQKQMEREVLCKQVEVS